ncbi:MAG: mechanosensitive ion channel family protein [Saprospiraceae bacterium]
MKQRLLLVLLLIPFLGFSQSDVDTVSLSSPYHTIHTHLWFLQSDARYDIDKAMKALPEETPKLKQRTIQLKQILDGKGLRVKLSQLPREANYRDSLAKGNIYVLFPNELPEVYVEKVGDIWLYSEETIERIPKLHRQVYPFGTDVLLRLIPHSDNYKFFGLKIWQYIGISLLLFLAWILHFLVTRLFRRIIQRVVRTRFQTLIFDKELIFKIARLASYVFNIWLIIKILPVLQLEVSIASAAIIGLKVLRAFFGILLGFKFVEILLLIVEKITDKTENTLDNQILPILKQTLYIVVATIGIIAVLNLLNVNVTALIAGLSIGGLALALAAQETVKNLIGSLMIFIDKPFQIGDLVTAGAVTGTIEMVGFRSTRIRTPENSVTTVPNGNLANMVVNNLGMRVYRRYKTDLSLTYSTSPEQIKAFIEGVKAIIASKEGVKTEGNQVVFNNMSASSLDVMLIVYFEVKTWDEELQLTQQILLEILQLAKELNVDFAFPSTSIYMEKG